jgi:hypothetical protein
MRAQAMQKKRQAALKRFDADQDGRLSEEERKAARKAIKKHRRAREVENRPKPPRDDAE